MARSEFRWNKKRKHYAYLFKDIGTKRKNLLITSKECVIKHKRGKIRKAIDNIPLAHHPNIRKQGDFFVIPKVYVDEESSFEETIYPWKWNVNDKRKIKRIKKRRRTR